MITLRRLACACGRVPSCACVCAHELVGGRAGDERADAVGDAGDDAARISSSPVTSATPISCGEVPAAFPPEVRGAFALAEVCCD